MTVFLLKDDSNMILVILYFIFSAWSCLLCFASRWRQHPKGEFALVYSTANVWSLIFCLASRWRTHPKGEVLTFALVYSTANVWSFIPCLASRWRLHPKGDCLRPPFGNPRSPNSAEHSITN